MTNPAEETTAGGIIIPDTAREKSSEGVIAAIAADASEQIAVGDRVIYKAFSGVEVSYNGQDYLIVPVGDLLAKICRCGRDLMHCVHVPRFPGTSVEWAGCGKRGRPAK